MSFLWENKLCNLSGDPANYNLVKKSPLTITIYERNVFQLSCGFFFSKYYHTIVNAQEKEQYSQFLYFGLFIFHSSYNGHVLCSNQIPKEL